MAVVNRDLPDTSTVLSRLRQRIERLERSYMRHLDPGLYLLGIFNGVERFKLWINPAGATDLRVTGIVGQPAILSLMGPNGANDYADYTYDGNNGDLDVSGNAVNGIGALNLRPNSYVNVWRIPAGDTAPVKLRVGNNDLTESVDTWYSDVAGEGRIEVSTGDLVLAADSGEVRVFTPTTDGKVRVGTATFTDSLDLTHDGTDGIVEATSGRVLVVAAATTVIEAATTGVTLNGQVVLPAGVHIVIDTTGGTMIGTGATQLIGFWGATPITRPTVTGSRGGNAALASLLAQLVNEGLIVDNTTA